MNNVKGRSESATFMPIRRRKKFRVSYAVFIIVALAYPITRFLIMWGYVNGSAIASSFTSFVFWEGKYIFDGFWQYGRVFNALKYDESMRTLVLNSFLYFPITCFVSLPLSVLFSYFLFKKIPAGGVYRVIFYLPSILPIVVLTMAFRFAFNDNNGFMNPILNFFGFKNLPLWFGSSSVTPRMIFVYCIWAGLGFNIVLLSGAMGRIPQDISEYSRLEGIGFTRELIQITIPLIWPTIVTTFILGMSSVLTVFLQPYFLVGSSASMPPYGTGTIALYIFLNYADERQIPYLAAFGLTFTIIYVPIILLSRWFLNRFFKDVAY